MRTLLSRCTVILLSGFVDGELSQSCFPNFSSPLFAQAIRSCQSQSPSSPAKREQVGELFGKPVFRDEIVKPKQSQSELREELRSYFLQQLVQHYQQEHEKETTPSAAEISAMMASCKKDRDIDQVFKNFPDDVLSFKAEMRQIETRLSENSLTQEERDELENAKKAYELLLDPEAMERAISEMLISHWKFERHLYHKFGGGRVLWQQFSVEAFDAMHNWLKSEEEQGNFKITDPELHRSFYHYWRDQYHGSFLDDDEEAIRLEFLEPEWLRAANESSKQTEKLKQAP